MVIIEELPPQNQVFINFCEGKNVQLYGFVYYLVKALKLNKINVYIDMEEHRDRRQVQEQLKKIAQSRIALVIFSGKYTESPSCLRELAKINDCVTQGKLMAIPIFFKLEVSTVEGLRGQFGDALMKLNESNVAKKKWKEALQSISKTVGYHKVEKKSPNLSPMSLTLSLGPESEIFENIVEDVKKKLNKITLEEGLKSYVCPSENNYTRPASGREKDKSFGIKKNLITCFFQLLLFICLQRVGYRTTAVVVGTNEDKGNNTPRYTDLFRENPPQIQVFINFRGAELRQNFVSYLVDALHRSKINVFIDNHEQRGEDLKKLFKRIDDSGIAIVVFSSRYTESKWCLEELVRIKKRVEQGHIKVLPIFYKVTVTNVKRLKGDFGDHFRDKEYLLGSTKPMVKQWKEAIRFVSEKFALSFDERSTESESDFVRKVVKEVLKILEAISPMESEQCPR